MPVSASVFMVPRFDQRSWRDSRTVVVRLPQKRML